MKKVVNEYIFDYPMLKKFYSVNLQTKFYLILLVLVLLSCISSFLEHDTSFGIFSLVIFLLGCVYYFLFPTILAKSAYKSFARQNYGADIHVRVSVNSKKIIVENIELKRKDIYPLESIKSIRRRKDIFCLYMKEKSAVLFSNDGFVQGDIKTLYSLIEKAKKS